MGRIYIDVIVKHDKGGGMTPIKILWDDARAFDVDRVTDVRRAVSVKAGGTGIRYTCIIGGRERYLFFDTNKWFVEGL